MLLEAGADSNQKDQFERTPLVCAIHENRPEAVQTLIEVGADLTDLEKYLDEAITLNYKEIVEVLIAAADKKGLLGPETDIKTNALFHSIHSGKTEIVKVLIKAGADVNRKTNDWGVVLVTPLSLARELGDPSLIKLLLEKGAVDTETNLLE